MSGHEKSRAVVLTALMVVSVFATGIAFTAGTVAADERTDGLNIDVQPDTVVPGSNTDTVIVEVTNGDAANETYQYTVTGPGSNVVTNGSSADDTFSFSINPQAEGDYTVEVTATGPNTDSDGGASDTDTETITSAYDLSIQPSQVAAGENTQVVTGQLTNDQGEGVSGQTLALRDTEADSDDGDDSNNAILDASTSDANGQVSFQFTPDQSGRYPITNTAGDITYENVTVTPNELTVESNRTQLLVSKTDTTDFTVSADGEQLNGSDLSNLDASITQNGSDVSSNGEYVDTDDDGNVDTYRVDIQPTASANAPVNATFSNSTFTGTTQIEVVTPNVQVNKTSPFTKGVRTSVELSATDPRDGSTINESSQFGIDIDGGTFEARSDEVTVDDTNGTTSGNNLELDDDEYAIISERTGADDDDVVNINATVFAYNQSAGTSEGTGDSTEERRDAFNQSVITHVVAVAGDSAQPQQPSAAAATQPAETESLFNYAGLNPTDYTFEPLNADASPDTIPLSGESEVTVNTSDAQDDPLPRVVDLHTESYRSGNTGEDGQITFSVNPDQTGTITQNTFYDDEFVGSEAPYEVQTDTIEVTRGGDDGGEPQPEVGDLDAPSNTMFGNVNVGDSKTQTVTLENEGNVSVTVTQTSIAGEDGDDFNVVGSPNAGGPGADDGSFTIAPGESEDVTVEYAPDEADDDDSARLISNTANDGREVTQLSGTATEPMPEPPEDDENTLTIVGQGERASYTFSTSSSDLQKSTANSANINANDEVRRGYVGAGQVGISNDSYTFNGSLETFGVSGNADVYLNGELINEQVEEQRNNVIEIAGTGERTNYDFASTNGNSRLEKTSSNNANVNGVDEIFRTTANGQAGISKDAYGFNGAIDSLDLNGGDANVYVNGRQVDPDNEQDNMITIVGSGDAASYEFSIDGSGLAPSNANYANTNANDEINGDTKTGQVGISADSNDYSGDITSFSSSGADIQVYVDGQQIDQDDVASEA